MKAGGKENTVQKLIPTVGAFSTRCTDVIV
jgi:hypothetical protein